MALTQTQVSQLYVTVIGRASEGDGNTFWQGATDMATAATDMLASAPAQEYFGSSLDDDQAFIEHIYENTLGKSYADDPEGVDFWVAGLQNSTRGQIVVDLISAVYDYADSTDATTKAAYDQFVNKVAVSDYTADNIATADVADLSDFVSYISGVTDDSTTVDAAKAAVDSDATVGLDVALTTDTDTIIGTEGDDTITGTTADMNGTDLIVDQTTIDEDTLSLTLTSALAGNEFDAISGIENIDLAWNAFGTATADLAQFSGADVTLSSSKVGYLGNATVTTGGDNTIEFGTNVDGVLSATGEDMTVVAGESTSLDVVGTEVDVTVTDGTVTVDGTGTLADDLSADITGGTTVTVGGVAAFVDTTVTANASTTSITATGQGDDSTATVTGGAATTTVAVNDADTIAIDAAAATTITADADTATNDASITIEGAAAETVTLIGGTGDDTADVTLGAAEVEVDLTGVAVETVNLTTAAGSEVTLTAGSSIGTVDVASTGAATLVTNSSDLDGATLTDSTTGLTIDLASTAGSVLTDVEGDINLTASDASTLNLANGTNVNVDADVALNAGQTFDVADGSRTTTDEDVLNIALAGDQSDVTTTNVETTNIDVTFDAAEDENNTDDDSFTVSGAITAAGDVNLTADADSIVDAIVAGTNDVTVAVDGDVDLSGTGVTAASLDLSGTTGDATVTDVGDADFTMVAAQGDTTVTLAAVGNDVEYTGSTGADDITLAAQTGSSVLSLSDGDNVVDAAAYIGSADSGLIITAGAGADELTLGAGLIADSTVVASLGAGNNTINLSENAGAANVEITAGSGDDTLVADTALTIDTLSVDLGAGTNTLDLSAGVDVSSANNTFTGVNAIIDDAAAGSTVDVSLVNGADIALSTDTGDANAQLTITENGDAAVIDLSGITLSNLVADAIGGVDLTTTTATDKTVTATAGDDAITTGDGDDTIDAGAGDDVITGGAGADDITLGTGTDIVNFIAEADVDTYDTVNGAGTDDAVVTADIVGTAAGWAEVTYDTDMATTIAAAVAGDGSVNSVVQWFTDDTDSYIVVDNSAGAAFVDGTDALIKVAGVTDLSGATLGAVVDTSATVTFA